MLKHPRCRGLLRKENQPLSSFVQPIEVLAHDLHPAWPAHQIPKQLAFATPAITLTLTQLNAALSPGATLSLPLTLMLAPSSPTGPIEVRSILLTLAETTTFSSASNALGQRQKDVAQSRLEAAPREILSPGPQGGRSWTLMLGLPGSKARGEGPLGFTVKGGHISVGYALRVDVLGNVLHRGAAGLGEHGLGELVASATIDEVLIDWTKGGREAELVRYVGRARLAAAFQYQTDVFPIIDGCPPARLVSLPVFVRKVPCLLLRRPPPQRGLPVSQARRRTPARSLSRRRSRRHLHRCSLSMRRPLQTSH